MTFAMRHLVSLGVLFLAMQGQAASLSVSSDQSVYSINDTVTLSISGDAGGASATGVFVRLVVQQSATEELLLIDALNQSAGPTALEPDGLFSATVELLYGGGTVVVGFESSSLDFFAAAPGAPAVFGIAPVFFPTDFLSQEQVQQTSLDGSVPWSLGPLGYQVVPEPSTGVLLALGLVELVRVSRRRRGHVVR